MQGLAGACGKIDGYLVCILPALLTAAMKVQQQLSDTLSCAETAVLANQLNSEKFTLISIHPGWVSTGTVTSHFLM